MRPVLIRLRLDHPWQFWTENVQGVAGVGIATFVLACGVLGILWLIWRRGWKWTPDDRVTVGAWVAALVILTFLAPRLPERLGQWFPTAQPGAVPGGPVQFQPVPISSLPIFGYGFFVLLGFLAAKTLAERRARREGYDLTAIFDLMFWTLIACVAGGRLFYIIQYSGEIFRNAHDPWTWFLAAVNLSNGGLVLIGAMLGGAVGYFGYCTIRGISALGYLDLLTPSIFVAVAFGRIGCLMYGCCFGDACSLPWAVTFGPESAAFETLAFRGFLSPQATETMPLHPTQIYSAINGLLLAFVTYAYYPFRPRVGAVFALGMMLYPLTRFFIEILRADELGQLGTGLTISQLLSLAMFTGGALFSWRLLRQGDAPGVRPPPATEAALPT